MSSGDDDNDHGDAHDPQHDEDAGEMNTVSGKPKVALAMSRILSKPTKTKSSSSTILSAHRGPEIALENAKLEAKALKALRAEKRQKGEKFRIRGDGVAAGSEMEKRLRKVATRGVVKLFNAIRAAQKVDEKGEKVAAAAGVSESATSTTKKTEVAKVAKKSFLSMLNAQQ